MEKLNWKFIAITALIAVFISVLSGLIGGVGASSVILRALVVLIIFAAFSAAVNFIAVSFLQSAEGETASDASPRQSSEEGSRVNIVLTEDDDAVPAAQLPDEGNNADGGIGPSSGENEKDSSLGERSRQVNLDMATSLDVDTLPDLGSFSSTFASTADVEEKNTDSPSENEYNENTSFSSGSKLSPEGIAGTLAAQNSPEDIAKAVRTVLHREETK